MKTFIIKTFYFTIPFILVLLFSIYLDAFKVFKNYDNYFDDNFIGLNREFVCTETYNKHRATEKFDSFIFGSSRSHAFKCQEWSKYLDEGSSAFHFDASGDGVYGVSNKVQYIDELGDSIKQALIVVDREFLIRTKNRDTHKSISPTQLSKESNFKFYFTFIKAQLNLKFIIAYLDYSLFKTHRNYMGTFIRQSKYPFRNNKVNCDIWYGYDEHIKIDSLGYYNNLIQQKVFERTKRSFSEYEITQLGIKQLNIIKDIFNRHNTNYKIIISPVYDQVPMENNQLQLLVQMFGIENVFNFSGENSYTEYIHNYYESQHYRPHVANDILKTIYLK